MQLLVQTAGLLAVSAALLALARPARALASPWLGLSLLAVAIAGLLLFGEVYRTGNSLIGLHRYYAPFAEVDRRAAGGTNFARNNEEFLRWVDARVPPRRRIFLVCDRGDACAEGLDEWITSRLGPRLFVGTPEKADWVMFYDTDPARAPYARRYKRMHFAPGFALAKVPR